MSNLGDVMKQVVCVPSNIPDDWRFHNLTNVCSPKQWRTISSSEMTLAGFPVFGANGFVGFYHEYNHEHETVAITCRGNTCGTINRIPGKTYITGNSMALDNVRSDLVSQDYLYYALKYRGVGDSISGSAQPQITGAGLRSIEFPAPPLPEQQKIAAILSSVDDVIEKTRTQIGKLKDLKTGMMQELLTKGIGHTAFKDSPVGRIPEGWKVVELKYFCRLQNGYAFKSEDFQEIGTPLIRISNIKNNNVSIDSDVCVNTADVADRFAVRRGDTLLAMSGATTGKTGTYQLNMPAFLNQRVGKFVADSHKADRGWVKHLVQTQWFSEAILLDAIGGAQPNISSSQIESIICPVPPIREQIRIARILDAIDLRHEVIGSKLSALVKMKKALMQDLLTGKVRVNVDNNNNSEERVAG